MVHPEIYIDYILFAKNSMLRISSDLFPFVDLLIVWTDEVEMSQQALPAMGLRLRHFPFLGFSVAPPARRSVMHSYWPSFILD